MKNLVTLTPPVSTRDHVEGRGDAPLTLVEYGDYQCPYCGEAHSVIKRLQKALETKESATDAWVADTTVPPRTSVLMQHLQWLPRSAG